MFAPQATPVIYPESDGKPMAETDTHRLLIFQLTDMLQYAFPNAYVSGNICLYYEEGNPKKMISPDVLLCKSQPPDIKRIYLAWEDQAQLDLVVELSSVSTKAVDHNKKKRLYVETLQVPYYVIFDPEAIYLHAFERIDGQYQKIDGRFGRFHLKDLGISIGIQTDGFLRIYDAEGNPVWTTAERHDLEKEKAELAEEKAELAEEKAQFAAKEAQEANSRAAQAEAQNEALQKEIEQLRRQMAEGH